MTKTEIKYLQFISLYAYNNAQVISIKCYADQINAYSAPEKDNVLNKTKTINQKAYTQVVH